MKNVKLKQYMQKKIEEDRYYLLNKLHKADRNTVKKIIPGMCEYIEYADYALIHLVFDLSLSKHAKKILRARGFRWLPCNLPCKSSWQRQLNSRGRELAQEAIEKIAFVMGVTIDPEWNQEIKTT